MDLVNFIFNDLFPSLLLLTNRVFDFFGQSVGDLIENVAVVDLPDWGLFDISLFVFMLGSGLTLFVGITLYKWIRQIVF
ncbi:MAG: hypothetical protein IJY47_01665 [Clostridia bacterium]|nr:hypothetical protein [Clostridia bacterium]